MSDGWAFPRAAVLAAFVAAASSCVPGGSTFFKTASSPRTDISAVAETGDPVADVPGPFLDALQPGRAVLIDGARLVKGLPGFGRNALPALSGEYAYLAAGQEAVPGNAPVAPGPNAEDGSLRVSVWFTREPLVYPDAWTTPAEGLKTCATLPSGISMLGSLDLDEETTLWALGAAGYTLFVAVPGTLADPCRFATIFTERFLFFQRYAERPEDASFPSILDIGR